MEFKGFKRNRNYKTILKTILISITIIVLLIPFFIWQNNGIVVSKYVKQSDNLKDAFSGFTIVQVSDLHSKNFKGRLLAKIAEQNPDIIVLTGDLIDKRDKDFGIAENFVKQVINLADIFFVTGNHEHLSPLYSEFMEMLKQYGVCVLDNEQYEIVKSNASIFIYGFSDSKYSTDTETGLNEDNFNIILCHRPHETSIFNNMGADLVLSGHAHGGQIRLPLIGGLVAPDQGFFPKYSEGMHNFENTSLLISRGLGNSILPLRVFNRPELIVVTLYK